MKLEQMCCSLQQAIRLRELGIEQRAQFWTPILHPTLILCAINQNNVGVERDWAEVVEITEPYKNHNSIARWTTGELGVMLPNDFLRSDIDKAMEAGYAIGVWPTNKIWPTIANWGMRTHYDAPCSFHETEAQARAAALIHLLENHYTTPQEVNERLMGK